MKTETILALQQARLDAINAPSILEIGPSKSETVVAMLFTALALVLLF
jgi:hypothetical protein